MNRTNLRFHWKDPDATRWFRTGICLHGHTFYSREYCDLISRYQGRAPLLRWLIRREMEWRGVPGLLLDRLACAWWTPPLDPQAAWNLERNQIRDTLGLEAAVSLTDHDNMDAAADLRATPEACDAPISVEWTVPFGHTVFHLGVHNLPPERARAYMTAMSAVTCGSDPELLTEILHEISRRPEALVVLNHPLWDEQGAGRDLHMFQLANLLARCGGRIHALELNGDRPWAENRAALVLAEAAGLPVVSGGDRHGSSPSPVLNLTEARNLAEFAEQVRRRRESTILVLPRYREPVKLRLLETICQVLRDYPDHSLGWTHWTQRVFYSFENGAARSLAELWGRRGPGVLNRLIQVLRLMGAEPMRPALRLALAEEEAL